MKTSQALSKIKKLEAIDQGLREWMLPKIYNLFSQKRLNKGVLPDHKNPEDAVSIREFGISHNGLLYANIEIWWGGDCYDYESVCLSEIEWNNL